ncbi:8505_t:CDS:2, partial [Diversispora eburnea]
MKSNEFTEELSKENIELINLLYEKLFEENTVHQKLINEIETYINAVDESLLTKDIFSEFEIVNNEIENNSLPDSKKEKQKLSLPPVTSKEVLNVLKVLIRYEEQISDNDDYNKILSNDLSKR